MFNGRLLVKPPVGLIFRSWDSQQPLQGEVRASTFGSSQRLVLNAECLPLTHGRMVLVLLWLPDNQLKLNSNERLRDEGGLIRQSVIGETGRKRPLNICRCAAARSTRRS